MNNQFSDLWSINKKEVAIGLLITVAAALVNLLWTGVNPVIVHLQETQIFDPGLFTTKVNLFTAWNTATVTALAYFGVIFNSGKKKVG